MYHINSKVDKPDIKYMYDRTLSLMNSGIKLADNVNNIYESFYKLQQEIGRDITKQYGILNPNSGPQVIKYLQSLDNIEVYEVCYIDNKWTSNKDALLQLSFLGYEFANEILAYRKAKKYSESIKSMVSCVSHVDGKVHPSISLGKTNRINYSDPALMNIPKKLLWHIVAPRTPGNALYSVDIKNQEPCILINVLNIDEFKSALTDSRGLYETLFSKVFTQKAKVNVSVADGVSRRIIPAKELANNDKVPPVYYTPIKPSVNSVYFDGERIKLIEVCNTITNIGVEPILPDTVVVETVGGKVLRVPVIWEGIKQAQLNKQGLFEVQGELIGIDIRCEGVYRTEFKQAWNAMTYGASIYGVKNICKTLDGEIIYRYFSKIPEFKKYKSDCGKLAANGVQRINTLFGNGLYANEGDQTRLQRVLMDLPIQGTGSDILALLIKHFDTEVIKRDLIDKLSLYYTRHDELIIEVNGEWLNKEGHETIKNILADILEHQINDWVPFKVDIKAVEVEPLKLLDEDIEE